MDIPDFKPIKQVRVSEEVTEQLKQAILIGQFSAGDKLPSERILAERFQVSRLSIREALRKLESFGFVTTKQGAGGGVYVTDLTFENLANAFLHLFLAGKASIRQVQQVRLIVEPETARLAASHVTPEKAEQLRKAYDDESERSDSLMTSPLQRFKVMSAVHEIIAEMSENPFLEGIIESIRNLTIRYIQIVDLDYEKFHTKDMHRPVVEAVAAGDEEAAYAAMRKHAEEYGTILLRMEATYLERTNSLRATQFRGDVSRL